MFDEFAHAGPGDTTSTEYLNGVSCGVLSTLCTIALQEPDRPYCGDESALNPDRVVFLYPASFCACCLYVCRAACELHRLHKRQEWLTICVI